MEKIRKVLVIYAGGTIGMQRNSDGVLSPIPNTFLTKVKSSELHDAELVKKYFITLKENQLLLSQAEQNCAILYDILEYKPLLDSSDMTYQDWIKIAKDIEKYYGDFHGFVVLHGTDTLAYTSSALSFMMEGLRKPIIITGSQIPIFETRSDAKDNFLASLIIAGCYDIPEVCVFFANKLFRGNRITKFSSNELDAFSSPNFPTLVDVGIDIKVNHHYIQRADPNKKLIVHSHLNPNVAILTFFPTITNQMLQSFLASPIKGLVIQSYGTGNLPSKRKDLLDTFKKAIEREVLIVNVTQCSRGTVSVGYETGKALQEIGIVCGRDITAEAALTKLTYVLGISGLTFQQRVNIMKSNLRGELSVTQ